MIIGVIGEGVVGGAVKYGMEKLGHNVVVHDIKYEGSTIEKVLDTELCFICVPTLSNKDGTCNVCIVEKIVVDLSDSDYKGVVAIKSTVSPGTTLKLIRKYIYVHIAFVPEFLRERCANSDFMENHDVCVIGAYSQLIYDIIKQAHGRYPRSFVKVTPTEAELVKYYNNIYNATLITLANSMYEVCKYVDADYTMVKEALIHRDHIFDRYLDCNDNFRGWGGMCLPKDLKALDSFCGINNINVDFFKSLLEENDKYKITVYDGMRDE